MEEENDGKNKDDDNNGGSSSERVIEKVFGVAKHAGDVGGDQIKEEEERKEGEEKKLGIIWKNERT
nr:1124_t:CDS:2 [Entrophospora candida]